MWVPTFFKYIPIAIFIYYFILRIFTDLSRSPMSSGRQSMRLLTHTEKTLLIDIK